MYVPPNGRDDARRGKHRRHRGSTHAGKHWPSPTVATDPQVDTALWFMLAVLTALALPTLLL